MDPGNDQVTGDRLSILPDDLIHKILSYISIKHVVQTSALSSRWRYIWTSMPYLNLSTQDFRRLLRFSKFVKGLLSGRDNQTEVHTVNLTFRGKVSHEFVQSILDYAFSHNVQQLNITCLPGHVYYLLEFPPSLFSSQSLKHLTLTGRIVIEKKYPVTTTPTWVLPALTTLTLTFFDDKCAGLLSNCVSLKNLTLKNCSMLNSFSISHPGLTSLTLEEDNRRVNVVAPQLKNLTIKKWRGVHVISAPNLSSLMYTDDYYSYKDKDGGPLQLPTDLHHLEKVDICIDHHGHHVHVYDVKAYTCKLFCLLQELHCVKFLTLNLELVKFFSSSVELISNKTSPFVNLKSLKIYPSYVTSGEQTQEEVTMPIEVKNYLLGGSPGATLTMVSYEEIRIVKNVTSAENLMRELQENIEQHKAPMEATARELLVDMRHKLSLVQRIKALLTKVPASHRDKDKLEARFCGLLTKIGPIMKHVMDHIDMQRDNKLHEPSTSSQPSS